MLKTSATLHGLRAFWTRWGALIRATAIVATLSFLFVKLSTHPALSQLSDAAPYVLVALLIAHIAFVLMAARWMFSMAAFEVRSSMGQSWLLTAESYFYYHITPLALGADVARFAKAFARAPHRPKLVVTAAVLADRAIGMATMILVFVFMAPAAFGWRAFVGFIGEHLSIVLMVCAIGAAAMAATLYILRNRLGPLIRITFQMLRTHAGALTMAFLVAAAMQVIYGLAIWVGALGWKIELTLPQAICASAGALFFNLVPASMFGVGAAQVAGAAIYLAMGLSNVEAAALIALSYLAHFSLGVLGGVSEAAPKSLKARLARQTRN